MPRTKTTNQPAVDRAKKRAALSADPKVLLLNEMKKQEIHLNEQPYLICKLENVARKIAMAMRKYEGDELAKRVEKIVRLNLGKERLRLNATKAIYEHLDKDMAKYKDLLRSSYFTDVLDGVIRLQHEFHTDEEFARSMKVLCRNRLPPKVHEPAISDQEYQEYRQQKTKAVIKARMKSQDDVYERVLQKVYKGKQLSQLQKDRLERKVLSMLKKGMSPASILKFFQSKMASKSKSSQA